MIHIKKRMTIHSLKKKKSHINSKQIVYEQLISNGLLVSMGQMIQLKTIIHMWTNDSDLCTETNDTLTRSD